MRALHFLKIVVEITFVAICTGIALYSGKWLWAVPGVLMTVIVFWALKSDYSDWRDEVEVEKLLRTLGGRATESQIKAAWSAPRNDGTVYSSDRRDHLEVALLRLRDRGQIIEDEQHLSFAKK
ncbi:MAG TPA: hypothetical protein VEC19_02565 [Usitatibacter sp.]|nr:hypothetical protein [Usitatibacter sp.]